DQRARRGAKVVVGDHLFSAIRGAVTKRLRRHGQGDHVSAALETGVLTRERDSSDHLGDSHDARPPFVECIQAGQTGPPARRNVALICFIRAIGFPAGSTTSRFTPSARTARAVASASPAEAARTPST